MTIEKPDRYFPGTHDELLRVAEALRVILKERDALAEQESTSGEDLRYFLFKDWRQWTEARDALADSDSALRAAKAIEETR
jgi:hypothetical protein